MATVIGVGMQMTASAAGMTKGLSDADKALQLLQKIVEQNQQSLQRFGTEATKTAANLEKLTKQAGTLSTIEVGRVLVDSFQAISGAFSSAAQNVLTLAGNVNQSLDSLNDLSARTGIGVEQLQGYALAAKMAGVDVEQFGATVQKLAVNIGKADPGGAFDKSLQAIGLTLVQLRGLAPEQQFAAIGEAISRLPTVADRAAAAVEIFGKQGAALAPLFREGAASIEELRARAERLGIIVSEQQINNVADMNDAFDLVRATIEGIIGQVIGNLAPAVTDVTNQFLKFVEEWSGAQGQGGTGIANAITDVLLQGAEIFAGVFDQFVSQFGGFTEALQATAGVFEFAGNAFTAITESLRQVFNLFESIGNGLTLGFGKILEAIGSWVSDDLQQYGADLANAASAELVKNQQEFLQAGANSFQAGLEAVGLGEGESTAAKRGEGAATAYVQAFRAQVEASQQPEIKVADNIADTRERLVGFLAAAGDGADAFLQQSVQTLDTFAQLAEEGGLAAQQIEVMNGFTEKVNNQLNQELALRQEAAAAAVAQAEADGKRVDSMLKTGDAATKLEEDLAAVERERQRISMASGDDAAARLEQLDALRAKLEEQQQALDQGFGQGFADAFKEADGAVNQAIEKAKEFGQAGFDAAQQLAQGIEAAQRQVSDGILSKEAYDQEVKRQQELFSQRIENEKAAWAERKKADEEAASVRLEQERVVNDLIKQQQFNGDADRIRAAENLVALNAEITRAEEAAAAARAAGDQEALQAALARLQQLDQAKAKEEDIVNGIAQQRIQANQRVEEFLRQNIDQRQQAEMNAAAELEKRKKEAAVNVQAIEAKLIEQRKQLEQAREDGDLRGAKAAQARITQLERVQRQEQQLADGRIQQQRQISQQFVQGLGVGRQAQQQQLAQYNSAVATSLSNANAAFAAFAQFQAQQARKMEELLTPTNRVAQTADIRTAEGQQLLLNLAQGGQDPALVEARLQTKQLQLIAQGIIAASQNYFNQPVAIVGGA